MGLNISSFEDCGNYGYLQIRYSKTIVRKNLIIHSLPHIRKWINEHPFNDNPDAPLFTSFHSKAKMSERLSRRGASHIFARVAKQAGINKKSNLHWACRHSRLDYSYRVLGLNEKDLCLMAGWNYEKSQMAKLYTHYNQSEMHMKILKANGLEEKTNLKRDRAMHKKICIICQERFPDRADLYEHPPEAIYCSCGAILDEGEARKVVKLKEDEKQFIGDLMKHPILSETKTNNVGEAMFESVMNNPSLLEKFKKVLSDNELI